MSLVRSFLANENGRDFIVGDIHGCFDNLRELLASVSFDESKDRLFSVGDLVDRGPKSEEAVEWLAKPWFHAVLGNHEQMAIDHVAGQSNPQLYIGNGGSWFLRLPRDRQAEIAAVFSAMPRIIEIKTSEGLIGIVHADPVFDDWAALVQRIEEPNVQNEAAWSRTRVQSGNTREVLGIGAVVCGHTILPSVKSLGNVIYIDTGAVAGQSLTMLELGAKAGIHSVKTQWQIAA